MRLFLTQLSWEFRKLWARPRTYLGFAGCLAWHLIASSLLRIPAIRLHIQRDLWKMKWDFEQTFSGLTTATHLLGEAATAIGTLALALVTTDLIAKEIEDGTLQTTFCRPISRTRVLLLKLIVALSYSTLLVLFISASALGVGLLFEGRGPLIMVAMHEGILGTFDFQTGLARYALATGLLTISAATGVLITFACSCFPARPVTAAAIALAIFFADNSIRAAPGMSHVAPYCLTTRVIAWRQVFNFEVPTLMLRRCYTELLLLDAGLIGLAWWAFRRREFKP